MERGPSVRLVIRVEQALPMASDAPVQVEFDGYQARAHVGLDPQTAPDDLAAALSTGYAGDVVAAAVANGEPADHVLLVVEEPALFQAAWEELRSRAPLDGLPVVRHADGPAALALVPLDLPVDLFIAEFVAADDPDHYPLDLPTDSGGAFRYFRTTRTAPATTDLLGQLCSGVVFDIVHLRGVGVWRDDAGALRSGAGAALGADRLTALVAAASTRVLLLEALDGQPAPLLDLAHRVLRPDGPSIIVIAPTAGAAAATAIPPLVADLYLNTVHDWPLDVSVRHAQEAGAASVALLRHHGGEHVLRISAVAQSLLAGFEDYHEAGSRLLELLRARPSAPMAQPPQRVSSLQDTVDQLGRWRGMTLDYGRESGAWEPLTDAARTLSELAGPLDEAGTAERVVNTWFATPSGPVASTAPLVADRSYDLNIQIGLRRPESVAVDVTGFPDEALQPFQSEEGVELQVVVYSHQLTVDSSEHPLLLPPPPADSPLLSIALRTPSTAGTVTARVCVYFRRQLLQSQRVTATVAESAEAPGTNRAETDFVLSGSLRDLEALGHRTVNILTNDDDDGGHTLAVVGGEAPRSFPLTDAEMRGKAGAARRALQHVCSTVRNGRPHRYRFEPDNAGQPDRLLEDLRELARLGYTLFTDLVTDHDRAYADELRTAVRVPTTIQVAITRSATYVFPWALVYDHRLVPHPRNVLCEKFLETARAGEPAGWVDDHACFTTGCPNADDANVICPSGFWGFRHIIEQPLGARPKARDGVPGARRVAGSQDAPRTIVSPGQVELLMAVSEELRGMPGHRAAVEALPDYSTDVRSDLFEIGAQLQRTDLQFVYFYCHGGREDLDVWLSVGRADRLYPSNMEAWDIRWASVHPLVFMNGCETVGVTPDDLLTFLKTLAWCRAAGVVGVEITIPELLAQRFAGDFLAEFAAGTPVGEVVRTGRRRLLEELNPLGLAYTPYCVADLRLVAPGG